MTTPEQLQATKIDDHKLALLVNAVTHIAGVYHDNGALRQRMSNEIVPLFQQAIKDARKHALEEAIAEVQVFECGGTNVATVAGRIGNKLKDLLK